MKMLADQCCGCSACALVCPNNAIIMSLNDEGFYTPIIDEGKCDSCRLCKSVCIDTVAENAKPLNREKVYVASAKDKSILERSSSGGIGHILAEHMVQSSQIACGVAYSEKSEIAKHITVDDIRGLGILQGSKYLQSDSFPGFSKAIEKGQGIIFGTPCQIAGVYAVLKKKKIREEFVLVDIFCHGVPSYLLWKNHLKYLKKNRKVENNESVSFRKKRRYILSIGKYVSELRYDAFYYFFIRGLVFNISCYTCPYRRSSYADIRIGDYAISKYNKFDFSPSVIIINTNVGERNIAKIIDQLEICPESYYCVDDMQEKGNKSIPIKRTRYLTEMQKGKSPMSLIRYKMFVSYTKGSVKAVIRLFKQIYYELTTECLQTVVNKKKAYLFRKII